jgi:hypothetical protein
MASRGYRIEKFCTLRLIFYNYQSIFCKKNEKQVVCKKMFRNLVTSLNSVCTDSDENSSF